MDPTDRPRERLLALGGDAVADRDLLAVVLGTGRRGVPAIALADEMLAAAGGLCALSRASPHELVRLSGIGLARALRVTAAFHLGRRAMLLDRPRGVQLLEPHAVWTHLRTTVAALTQEAFFVLGLDARGGLIAEVEIARGTLTGVEVHPRDVFRPLIRMSAALAVVAHNHPSGDPSPSEEDRELTVRLQTIGQLVGIPIVDHIVVTAASFASVTAHGTSKLAETAVMPTP
jgi:DNA repair protein RadC